MTDEKESKKINKDGCINELINNEWQYQLIQQSVVNKLAYLVVRVRL